MKEFSSVWKSSTKPAKQRKYRFKAPLHIRGRFLNAHLSKELRQKYHARAARVRLNDRVRIMRGQFKRQEGKIEEVDLKKSVIYVSKIEHTKRDGTKARYPLQPSNVMIVELNTDDKRRFEAKEKPTAEKKAGQKAPKPSAKPAEKTFAEKASVAVQKKTAEKKTVGNQQSIQNKGTRSEKK